MSDRNLAFRLSEWHVFILDLHCNQMRMNRAEAIRGFIEDVNEREHFDLIESEKLRRLRLEAERSQL